MAILRHSQPKSKPFCRLPSRRAPTPDLTNSSEASLAWGFGISKRSRFYFCPFAGRSAYWAACPGKQSQAPSGHRRRSGSRQRLKEKVLVSRSWLWALCSPLLIPQGIPSSSLCSVSAHPRGLWREQWFSREAVEGRTAKTGQPVGCDDPCLPLSAWHQQVEQNRKPDVLSHH